MENAPPKRELTPEEKEELRLIYEAERQRLKDDAAAARKRISDREDAERLDQLEREQKKLEAEWEESKWVARGVVADHSSKK